mgnify:CR=1 FL=1
MAERPESSSVPFDPLARALARERLDSARRLNILRLVGVSAFFALHLVFGLGLGQSDWRNGLPAIGTYCVLALIVFAGARRESKLGVWSSLAVPLVDMPLVFWVEFSHLRNSPTPLNGRTCMAAQSMRSPGRKSCR